MKTFLTFVLILVTGITLNAQVNVDVVGKVNKEANQRANSNTDKGIDKAFDSIEDGIGNLFKKKNKKNKSGQSEETQATQNNSSQQESNETIETANEQEQKPVQPNVQWSKFDFVPGDEVIFEDGPSADEENGEFPSKWDLEDGNAEIAEVDGEKVVIFPHGGTIVPFLKNPKEDYLPEVFTVEFDAYFQPENPHRIFFSFYDSKNQKSVGNRIYIYSKSISYDESSGAYSKSLSIGGWRHFSIAVTKDKLKVYLNDERLINLPHMGFNPTGITFEMDGYAADKVHQYAKNIRIAKGGVKYYDRVLSDGKIIVNGIRFDVNKATIKPESNGAINEIFQLMQKQTDLNFSVEGHTDSDGDEALNQTLSEQRAKAVMDRLISMGISANRLKYAGWGESKPIGENVTPEGKANNRRVEFVKFTGNAAPASTSIGNSNNPAFDKLDKKSVATKLENLPDEINIQVSNATGIVNGAGTIILYATSDGNMGKMEILNVDKNDNYKLTVKYVTFNYDGSVHSKSDNLEIEGTYTCDLDKGNAKDMIQSEIDFHLSRNDKTNTTIYPGETAILRILPN